MTDALAEVRAALEETINVLEKAQQNNNQFDVAHYLFVALTHLRRIALSRIEAGGVEGQAEAARRAFLEQKEPPVKSPRNSFEDRMQSGGGGVEGWQLVPVEPTKEMIEAALTMVWFYDSNINDKSEDQSDEAVRCYRAMLAAAPLPPATPEQEGQS